MCSAIGVAVDGHGQGLAHPRVGVALLVEGQAEEREAGRRRLGVAAVELLLRDLAHLGGDPGQDVEVAGQRVGVGGRRVGVHAVLQRLDRRLLRAGEPVGGHQRDARARDVLALGPEGTVADRVGAERLRVVEERLGQREEGVVADGHRELRERCAQGDGEGQVVDDAQTAHLRRGGVAGRLAVVVQRGLQVAVALDVREEVGARLGVRAVRGVVPGVDEGRGGDRGPVVERPPVVQRDGPGDAVVGRDAVRHPGVADLAVGAVLDQPGPQRLEDLGAVLLHGVARDERGGRLADGDADRLGRVLVTASRRAAGAEQNGAGERCESQARVALGACHVSGAFPSPRSEGRGRGAARPRSQPYSPSSTQDSRRAGDVPEGRSGSRSAAPAAPGTTKRARPEGRTRWSEESRLSESNRRPSHYE